MARFFYNISIISYQFLIWLLSPFNPKARLWINGRKHIFTELARQISASSGSHRIAWFHCASLGEFEQGRPVIEAFRQEFPDFKIMLTFFSPSGYEVRKNYAGADFIFYLPADTAENAEKFIETVNPSIAFFVKYEFWYNYLNILHQKHIPAISFSAIFREKQIFFKSYGTFYRSILDFFTHIFVQNQSSFDLLRNAGIQQISVGGDTRFDRVRQIALSKKDIKEVNSFKNGEKLLIIGSCWKEDFDVLLPFINNFKEKLKIIIAPHEIHDQEIEAWRRQLTGKSLRFSEINQLMDDITLRSNQVLFIDNIGMLSSLYQYAEFAWIGGAYGKGLHNTLEAATFGLPIFFGNRNYLKFQEARDLISLKGANPIGNTEEFTGIFEKLFFNENLRHEQSERILEYVKNNVGGTEKIIAFSKKLGL